MHFLTSHFLLNTDIYIHAITGEWFLLTDLSISSLTLTANHPPPHSTPSPKNRIMVNQNVLIILNEITRKYNKHIYVKAKVLLEFHLRLGRGLNSHIDMQNLLS